MMIDVYDVTEAYYDLRSQYKGGGYEMCIYRIREIPRGTFCENRHMLDTTNILSYSTPLLQSLFQYSLFVLSMYTCELLFIV